MFIGEKGLALIKEFEGCILQSYDDYNDKVVNTGENYRGTLTIGYGHIEGVYAGQKITQEEADALLKNDMNKYCSQVQEVIDEGTISFPVNQNMFDALVSFDYNLGQGNLRTLCQNRDKITVADKMLLYINPGSIWEAGLLRRRKAERELFLSEGDNQPIHPVNPTPQPQVDPIEKGKEFVGNRCTELQQKLNKLGYNCGNVDGIFGQNTYNQLIKFQQSNGLTADGLAGSATFAKLDELIAKQNQHQQGNDWIRQVQHQFNIQFGKTLVEDGIYGENTQSTANGIIIKQGASGEITRLIQVKLNSMGIGTNGIDGDFGNGTANGVRTLQARYGLGQDGVVGGNTWRVLFTH